MKVTFKFFKDLTNYQLFRLFQEQNKLCQDLEAPDYEYNCEIWADIENEISRRSK